MGEKSKKARDQAWDTPSEWVALSTIVHGPEGYEGEPLVFEAGDILPEGCFTDDEIQRLRDIDVVAHKDEFGRNPIDADLDAREAALARREAELAEREAALQAGAEGGVDEPAG